MYANSREISHERAVPKAKRLSCYLFSSKLWKCLISGHYYRPQTWFAKVMFLQVSVCPQGGVLHPGGGFSIQGGGGGVLHLGGFSIWGGSPSGGVLHPGGFSIWGGSPSGGFSIPGGGVLHPVNVRAVRILLECILVSGIFEYWNRKIFLGTIASVWFCLLILEFIQYKDGLGIYCFHHTVNFHEHFH